MKIKCLHIISCFIFVMMTFHMKGQIGFGVAYGVDLYQYHENPLLSPDQGSRGLGSAIFNLNIGPKLWIGVKDFSIAVEGQLGIAPFAFDVNEYKGLGAFSFPLMASVNYKGLSGFQKEGGWGIGLAGGIEYVRTDLYFLADDFTMDRTFYNTIFGQLNLGFGSQASAIYAYVRYGEGDRFSRNFHVGIMLDQNLTFKKKLKKRKEQEANENNPK